MFENRAEIEYPENVGNTKLSIKFLIMKYIAAKPAALLFVENVSLLQWLGCRIVECTVAWYGWEGVVLMFL